MSTPPPTPGQAARRPLRRQEATERCWKAVRRTLAFVILTTPLLYYPYVLCCHMPFGLSATIPKLFFMSQCWFFFRNAYLLCRDIRFAPLLAPLPFLLISGFLFAYPPPFHEVTDPKLYFDLFLDDRMDVVRMIEDGSLRDPHEYLVGGEIVGMVRLPDRYRHVSFPHGEVPYSKGVHGINVLFWTSWNVLSWHQGFQYYSDDTPSNWLGFKSIDAIERIAPCWYYLEF